MASEADATRRAPWLVRSTSPVHFLIAFAAGALLQTMFELPLPPAAVRPAVHLVGTILADASLLVALWCFLLFARRRTTIMPAHTPSQLIVRGPFRWSRNPIYVSLAAAYAGLALMLDVPWALALMPLPLLALQRVIIPFEETRLVDSFGGDYLAYRTTVPRWL